MCAAPAVRRARRRLGLRRATETDERAGHFETQTISIGPSHPATHGIVHLIARLDGKTWDVTQAAGLGKREGFSTSALWFDYDRDGLLDLFVVYFFKRPTVVARRAVASGFRT